VLPLLQRDLDVAQIARPLVIAESTAATHVANLREKLGAHGPDDGMVGDRARRPRSPSSGGGGGGLRTVARKGVTVGESRVLAWSSWCPVAFRLPGVWVSERRAAGRRSRKERGGGLHGAGSAGLRLSRGLR